MYFTVCVSGGVAGFFRQYGREGGLLEGDMDRATHSLNSYNIDSITVDPNFNFLNKISYGSDSETLNFLSNNNESPYDNSSFNCDYIDITNPTHMYDQNKLRILTLNIQSLQAKFSELKELIVSLSLVKGIPDVICLQEIWQINENSDFNIPGYKPLVYKTRRGSVQGGGVGIYIHNELNFTIDTASTIFFDRVFESLVIEISNNKIKKTKIATIYRPGTAQPNLTATEEINQSLELLSNLLNNLGDTPSYICGDLNLDALNYSINPHVTNFVDLLFSQGFIQTIIKPTRCTSHSATLIDYCITNVISHSYNSSILISKVSDHFPILITIPFEKVNVKQKIISLRDFSTNNVNNFRQVLNAETWDSVYTSNCPQLAFNMFSDKFFSLYNLFFPLQTRKFNKNIHKLESWYTNGLMVSRREKIRLEKVATCTPSEENISTFKSYRNLYNKLLKAAKKLYFEKELCSAKCNLKKTWTLIRQAINLKAKKSRNTINNILIDNIEVSSPKLISEYLNKFFATAPKLIVDNIRTAPCSTVLTEQPEIPLFNLQENAVTAAEIIDTVKLLE